MTVCVRAGCGRETAALASFDRENLVVRLRNVDSDSAFTIGLCETHVSRLTVPIGWTLADERSAAPDEKSSLPTPRGERVDTSDEATVPRRPSSPEGGLLNRAFQGPESESRPKRRQSWLERADEENSAAQTDASDTGGTGDTDAPPRTGSAGGTGGTASASVTPAFPAAPTDGFLRRHARGFLPPG